MAKTQGALFSEKAQGTLANLLTYQGRKGFRHCHKKLTRVDPATASQLSGRTKFADAVTAWQALTAEQKATYNAAAVEIGGLSGYNYFIRLQMEAVVVTYKKFGSDTFGGGKYGGP
jgi:hypothetical protein